MGSKIFLLLGLLMAVVLLISSEVAARDLAETSLDDNQNGYPGRVGNGGYPGRGGNNRGYPGGGRGGRYCRHGCCGRGYNGKGCRCCSYAGEAVDAEPEAKPHS